METQNQYLHEVVITAIIVKDGKYLITRRAANKKRFPGMWTVPGGKMETSDYLQLPKDTEFYWYNVLEQTLKREVREEVGLNISNVEYVTSLATIHADGSPSLVISCMADYVSGEVVLQEGETDQFAWVSLEEAKDYSLIDGIYDELVMTDKKRKGDKTEWVRASEQK
jgi:8-oxo-dGTP diphosphatase